MEKVSPEFSNVVKDNDILMARIMLKDSLLVDTSFTQFNHMADYAQENGLKIWISDDEDTSFETDKKEDLNVLLVQLVNSFSVKRVNYIKGLILKKYPTTSKNSMNSQGNTQSKSRAQNQFNRVNPSAEKTVNWDMKSFPIMPIKPSRQAWDNLKRNRMQIKEIMADISEKRIATTRDILRLKDAAQKIVDTCDKLLRK